MPPSDEDQQRIIARIKERTGGLSRGCALCGSHAFFVTAGYVQLMCAPDMDSVHLVAPFIPLVGLTCGQCGNTNLLNLITLGLADLFPQLVPITSVDTSVDA